MKKAKAIFLIIIVLIISLLVLASCEVEIVRAEKKVKSLSLDNVLNYYYFLGDELQLDDANLVVIYENGDMEIVPVKLNMIEKSFSMDSPGVKQIKVNYKDVSTFFEIEVLDLNIDRVELVEELDAQGRSLAKKVYIENTDFDVTGLKLKIYFQGSNRVIEMPVLHNMITMFDSSVLGAQDVQITYRSKRLTFPVNVVAKNLVSISVKSVPTARTVFVGKEINPAGLVLNFHYDNNRIEEVAYSKISHFVSFSFVNTAPAMAARVTVNYKPTPTQSYSTHFTIQVVAKQWQSMRIVQAPLTMGIILSPAQYDNNGNIITPETRTEKTALNRIVQGDRIDLSSGILEITYTDGSTERMNMNNSLIGVYNNDTKEKAEIVGLTIEPVAEENVPGGDYYLNYTCSINEAQYNYDTEPEYTITVKDSSGNAIPVVKSSDQRELIEVVEGRYYVITITATVVTQERINNVERDVTLVTTKSYTVYTQNTTKPPRTLDISSAGEYELIIIYSEDEACSITMNATVLSKQAVSLELDSIDEVTKRTYVVGEKVNISFVKYRLIYNNGQIDAWQPVNVSMLSPDCNLDCLEPTTGGKQKTISFTAQGITSASLNVNIVPIRIESAELFPPTNNYVKLNSSTNTPPISLEGGYITAYLNNNTREVYTLSYLSMNEFLTVEFDPAARDENNIENARTGSYTARIIFNMGGAEFIKTFEYHVVSRAVERLELIVDNELFKEVYYENEDLSFEGLSLGVTWNANPLHTTEPVTNDMLYNYTRGDTTIKLRYGGRVVTYSIYIIPNEVTEITITSLPKTVYFEQDREYTLNLNGIRIAKKYNNGRIEEEIGITLSPAGVTTGWFFKNSSQVDFRDSSGRLQTVVLAYRFPKFNTVLNQYEIKEILVSYDIKVVQQKIKAITLYDPRVEAPVLNPRLCSVSKGFALNLYGIMLYVEYEYGSSGDAISVVPLTNEMVDYAANDLTLGVRNVEIKYNGATCRATVLVTNTYLNEVIVETMPKSKYMIEENLELTGGTIRRVFKAVAGSGESDWFDIMDMAIETDNPTGFNSNLDENTIEGAFVTQPITLWHAGKSYTFDVQVYKKFKARVNYYSTISFYGDVPIPQASLNLDVEGFTLPFFELMFLNSKNTRLTLENAVEEVVTTENGRFIRYVVTENVNGETVVTRYLKLVWANNEERYIDESLIIPAENYPTNPPEAGDSYLILIKVYGNKYYREINYAVKEMKIINRFIELKAYEPNENALVWFFNTSDNERAAYLASLYIENSPVTMTLATPTTQGIEIIISSPSGTYDNVYNDIYSALTATYWSYEINELVGDTYKRRTVEVRGDQRPSNPNIIGTPISSKLMIIQAYSTFGVNYKTFGDAIDKISFQVPSGGLIAVRKDGFYKVDVFIGSLVRERGEDVIYKTSGDFKSGFELTPEDFNDTINTSVWGYYITDVEYGYKTISNINYFITFTESKYFMIKPKEITSISFQGVPEGQTTTTRPYTGEEIKLTAQYQTEENGAPVVFAENQLRYFREEGEDWVPLDRGTYPVELGKYKVSVCYNYIAKDGYANEVESKRVCYLEIV